MNTSECIALYNHDLIVSRGRFVCFIKQGSPQRIHGLARIDSDHHVNLMREVMNINVVQHVNNDKTTFTVFRDLSYCSIRHYQGRFFNVVYESRFAEVIHADLMPVKNGKWW